MKTKEDRRQRAKSYETEEHFRYYGTVVYYETGWDAESGHILLADLIEKARQVYPGVPFEALAITIAQDSNIVMYDVSKNLDHSYSRFGKGTFGSQEG